MAEGGKKFTIYLDSEDDTIPLFHIEVVCGDVDDIERIVSLIQDDYEYGNGRVYSSEISPLKEGT